MFTFVYHSTTIAQEYCSSFTNVMQLKESESKGRRHHQPKGRQRERPTINAPCGGALVGAPTPPSPPPSGRARGSLAGNYQFAPPMAARPDGSPNANKEQYLTGARFPTRAPLGRGRGSTAPYQRTEAARESRAAHRGRRVSAGKRAGAPNEGAPAPRGLRHNIS